MSKKIVTLHTFYNPMEAEIVKGKLESEGITTFILDQNLTYTVGPTNLGGYRLQIDQNDYIKASQIFTTIRKSLNKKCLRMLYFEKFLTKFQIWHFSGVPKILTNPYLGKFYH